MGKAKGKKQILWERGLFVEGMLEKISEDDPKGRDQVRAAHTPPKRARGAPLSSCFFPAPLVPPWPAAALLIGSR